jgi:hypothetical protein
MLHEEISSNGSLSQNEPRPETARRIVADVGLDVFSRVAQPSARGHSWISVHVFVLRSAQASTMRK